MAKDCILEVLDEVNVKFQGLDVSTRRKMSEATKYFLHYARHTPAYKLGRWDGCQRFCDLGARTYINILDKVIPVIEREGYVIHIDDKRPKISLKFDKIDANSYSHIKWPEDHVLAGEPIVLHDHQVEVCNIFFDEPQGVGIAPTGAGKTIVTAIMCDRAAKYGRTVLIVPTKDLVTQTEEDFINMGLDVGVYFGDRKELGRTHTICTWQSLDTVMRSRDRELLEAFTDGVNAVIVDETHKAKSDALKKILTGPFANCPIRWGVTGTLPEEESDRVALECYIGPVLGKVNAKDLQDKGILANLHVNVWQLKDFDDVFNSYQEELKWLVTNKNRLTFLADKIVNEVVPSGNTLILVDRVQTGELLEQLIPGSVFINGSVKSTDRKKEYKDANKEDGKIIIATYGVASTGISINRIFNLVLLEAGKSFIRVIQSIGRSLRVAKDKDFANVYDVCSTCKYSKRHLAKRKKFYKEAQYPFSIKKIGY